MEVSASFTSDTNLIYAYASKLHLKGAIKYVINLLLEDDLVTKESPQTITVEMIQMGEKIHRRIIKLLMNYNLITDEELLRRDETEKENTFHNVQQTSSRDEDYEPQEKKTKFSVIPMETKIKVNSLARKHPKWTLKSLQQR
ncbi:hypothetical protein M0802_015905 [Mischocyttarus mexicanus]|nr:hypothetical protein M0802_015905 [Mischocyttarus mexicanus]